jgi:hypothetical protein
MESVGPETDLGLPRAVGPQAEISTISPSFYPHEPDCRDLIQSVNGVTIPRRAAYADESNGATSCLHHAAAPNHCNRMERFQWLKRLLLP